MADQPPQASALDVFRRVRRSGCPASGGPVDLGECQQMAALPRALSHSWTVKQQCVDLLAEGLWEELLDDEQPRITVMDW